MRRLLAAVSLLLLSACASSTVPAGMAIHYVKSNLDGSKPSLVTIYFAGPDTIEVSKSEKDLIDSADITAHIDWSRLTADDIDAGVLLATGEREKRAALTIRGNELQVKLGDAEETLSVDTFPLHVYNFDLMSLNAVLPRLEAHTFRFAVAEPTFGAKPGVMELRGFAEAEYVGTETLRGVLTRKYRVGGKGMAGAVGWLWINDEDGYMETWESPLANNPGWNSLRLERRGVSSMTAAEWQAYKVRNVGVGVP
ncbi:MAG TPA: hypothetical protein VEU30_17395 [Thermoanaerobaculia bacterium]|nr:hypothetical protein [Thermoanaerobaculia bacterium]